MRKWPSASRPIARAAVRNGAPSRRRAISRRRWQGCETTPVLVDCLTLWLSNHMLADADIDLEMARLEDALAAAKTPIVLIANEVGSGIVPDHPLGRKFRDLQGVLNQRMAARADRVVLVVAGLPLALKGSL